MEDVETFARRPEGSGQVSRRRLIQAFAATFTVAQIAGLGFGGPEAATAVPVATVTPPAYDGIIGLL